MNKTFKNLAIIPTQCHLWQQPKQPISYLETVKEYSEPFMTDADERERSLKQCSDCGQLYFYEYLEWIDWQNGNDPSYQKFIPVATIADADTLSTVSQFEIFAHSPRLQIDYPVDANAPVTSWIK